MVTLRELKREDAEYMLEWMQNPDIQKAFQKEMGNITLKQAQQFCDMAAISGEIQDGSSLHFAITEDDGEYLGTISLKDINLKNLNAEYSIATRKCAHGKGIAYAATGLLLKKAFREYHLHRVYLNVLSENHAAIKLYERCGFQFEGEFREHLMLRNQYADLKWYGMVSTDYDPERFEI